MDAFFEHVVDSITTATTYTNNFDDALIVVYFAEVYDSFVYILIRHNVVCILKSLTHNPSPRGERSDMFY